MGNRKEKASRYDMRSFSSAVRYYENIFADIGSDRFFADIDMSCDSVKDRSARDAFFSVPALSAALHNLGKDLFLNVHFSKSAEEDSSTSSILSALEPIWKSYEDYTDNVRMTHKTATLIKFIQELTKKDKDFEYLFKRPCIITATKEGFLMHDPQSDDNKIDKIIDYRCDHIKSYRIQRVLNTTENVLKNVFNLKRKEKLEVSLDLFPDKNELDRPKEDVLDSFFIAYSALMVGEKMCSDSCLIAHSTRYKMSEAGERTADLMMMIAGCEHKKLTRERIFSVYRRFSKEFGLKSISPPDAVFGVFGKGVYGRHLFGDAFGYPTQNKNIRWTKPDRMFYKFPWSPESKYEKMDPVSRIGFTDTLPLDIYADTCNIDWFEMHKNNQKITDILNKSEKVIVKSPEKNGTNLTVFLSNQADGTRKDEGYKRRFANNSDVDIREMIDRDHLKKTGERCGNMGNLPGGESFITPEYIDGRFVGDVVIHIDSNYMLSKSRPIVVEADRDGYRIVSGPRKIISKIEEKKKESYDKILRDESSGTVSKNISDLKKNNFGSIGEFAINTNPKAKPCNYLIVNEKIANMMHIALGSGFDADKATQYHYDIVFDSKSQKLDVFGVTSAGKKKWILKEGKFAL